MICKGVKSRQRRNYNTLVAQQSNAAFTTALWNTVVARFRTGNMPTAPYIPARVIGNLHAQNLPNYRFEHEPAAGFTTTIPSAACKQRDKVCILALGE
jgi:hypothetical protein